MPKNSETTVLFSNIVEEKDNRKREDLIAEIVSLMSLDEKLFFMGGNAKLSELIQYGTATFNAGGCERLGIPRVRFTDGPRGVMLNKSTCFPVSMARGATWDVELEERVGSAIGVEAREQGANLAGSVCINLLRHPAWGRAQETYGEDTHHLGEMGVALTKGIQKHIMACLKHFAVNSIENSRFWVNVEIDDRTLMEIYLPHFRKCVDAGAASVMGAYNRINGPHCCHSRRLLTEILKDEWGFDGFVVSDWSLALRGSDAASAGLDIEMPNAVFSGLPLKILVRLGKVSEEVIDNAVTRIIRLLARFQEIGNVEAGAYIDKVACREHTELALEVARKSIVLLKNNDSILPLDRTKIITLAVIGELADKENIGDKGSSNLHPPYVVTLLQGIKNKVGDAIKIEYCRGDRLDEVKKIAGNADAVVVVAGLTSDNEGEFISVFAKGGDRSRLSLSPKQEAMIKAAAEANRNCVVALEGGSAITMERWKDDAAAILMVWYPGMEGGNAFAEILFGDVNPSGKLPLTFPVSQKQLVPFNKWTKHIKYEYFNGYRHLDKENHAPLFPFGFGLSYAEYKYSNLKINPKKEDTKSAITVTAEIKNVGKVAGEEIAQLYIGYPASQVVRPIRELKGFCRAAIEPGKKKTVSFEINPQDIAYYNEETKSWKIEAAEYEVYVGSSSQEKDLKLKGSFRISEDEQINH